jgi:cytochrome oxidase Cu insertion factor (SCO1/SenC/PrrC family)
MPARSSKPLLANTERVYNARLLLYYNSKEKRMKGIVRALGGILLLLGLGGQVVAPTAAAAQEEAVAKTNLKVGDVAPDFSLLSNKWEQVKLSDYRGKKNVILAFYVLAFTGG